MEKETLLTFYQAALDRCPNIELKGKNLLYTSDNGHMFSITKMASSVYDFQKLHKKPILKNTTHRNLCPMELR